jgi:hypothetical protein
MVNDYYTAPQVAELIGRNIKTVHKMALMPRFEAYKYKGAFRFPAQLIDDFLVEISNQVHTPEIAKILKITTDVANELCQRGFLDARKDFLGERWVVEKSRLMELPIQAIHEKGIVSVYEAAESYGVDVRKLQRCKHLAPIERNLLPDIAEIERLLPNRIFYFNGAKAICYSPSEMEYYDQVYSEDFKPALWYTEIECAQIFDTTIEAIRTFRNGKFESNSCVMLSKKIGITYLLWKFAVDEFDDYFLPSQVAEELNILKSTVNDMICNKRITNAYLRKELFPGGKEKYIIKKEYDVLEQPANLNRIYSKITDRPQTPSGYVPVEKLIDLLGMSLKYLLEEFLKPYSSCLIFESVSVKKYWFITTELYETFKVQVRLIKDSLDSGQCSKQVSRYVPISRSSVNKMCKNGSIPGSFKSSLLSAGAPAWHIPKKEVINLVAKAKKIKDEFIELHGLVNQSGLPKATVLSRINSREVVSVVFNGKIYVEKSSIGDSFYRKARVLFDPTGVSKFGNSDYYLPENQYSLLITMIEKDGTWREKTLFWESFKLFALDRIYGTSSKGLTLKTITSGLYQTWSEIVSKLSTDLCEKTENEVEEVLTTTKAFYVAKKNFLMFWEFAAYRNNLVIENEFYVSKRQRETKTKEVYDMDFMAKIEYYVRMIDVHTHNAMMNPSYANMWLFVLMHLSNLWRKSDLVYKLKPIDPTSFGIPDMKWFEENIIDLKAAQCILNHYTTLMAGERISKTGGDLFTAFDPTIVQAMATALCINSFHKSETNSEKLMFTFLSKYGTLYGPLSTHYEFFYLEPMLKAFRSKKMNTSIATYFYNPSGNNSENALNLRLRLLKMSRGHFSEDSIGYYILANSSISPDNHDASYYVSKNGEFGWTFTLVQASVLNDLQRIQDAQQSANSLEMIRGKFEIAELEGLGKFLARYNSEKEASLLSYLLSLEYNQRIDLMVEILFGKRPAKTRYGQCLKFRECPYPGASNCFGCEYFIPQFLILVEAAKELRRLGQSIVEAKYVLTAMRDIKLAADICKLFNEARERFDEAQVDAYLSKTEQLKIESMIKSASIRGKRNDNASIS